MPRRGRSASPPAARGRRAPSPPTSSLPAHRPSAAPGPVAAQPQQPSLFGQMAATAGGVAVGSAVGHVAGHALTGMFSGGGSEPATKTMDQAPVSGQNLEPQGRCAFEIKQFLSCAEQQHDITLCEGFKEAMRQCKMANNY